MRNGAISGKVFDRTLVLRMLRFAKPHASGFVLSSLLLLLLMALNLSMPLVLGKSVDTWLKPTASDAESNGFETVLLPAMLLCALGIAAFGARYVQTRITNRTGQRVVHDLRCRLFEHLSSRDLRFFDRHNSGLLVTRVTQDIDTINEFFVSGVDVLLADLLRIAGISVVLLVLDWRLALATLCVVPLILMWAFWFQRRGRVFFREVRERSGEANGFATEAIAGITTIRAYAREDWAHAGYSVRNDALRDAHLRTVRNFSWFFPGTEFLPALGTALLLLVGYQRVTNADLPVGTLLSFWFYLAMFIEPLRQVADRVNILQSAIAAGDRVFHLLDTGSELSQAKVQAAPASVAGEVRFENVEFAYGETPVLRGLSFTLAARERVALVGSTGAGKSTVMALMARLYDPDKGRVLLDGRSLDTLPPEFLRRQVGVVLQDVFLFAGTLRENLLLGSTNCSDDMLRNCIVTAQAEGIATRLGGLDGLIHERGEGLSSGEKQLLAFARTLAQDPAILILDEATASIDTETEARLSRALRSVLAGRTALVIAHRLSTVEHCDRALVLHHGSLAEVGPHRQLLHAGGLYSRLYRLQFRSDSAASAAAPEPPLSA